MVTGKFVVIYGANNLGKSTQVEMLVKRFAERGMSVCRLKYPIYDLEPTGPEINRVLREGMEISDLDFQKLCVQNRRDFEPELMRMLEEGWVVAEDYKGTGIAWGLVNGIPLEDMERMNEGLLEEGCAILLDGENRFTEGVENGHRHETGRDWIAARDAHRMLRKRYGWEVVNANQDMETVKEEVVKMVEKKLGIIL